MVYIEIESELREDRRGFLRDCDDFIICWTDGASFGNNRRYRRYSGYGVYFGPSRTISQRSRSNDPAQNTNNYAELKAIAIALR